RIPGTQKLLPLAALVAVLSISLLGSAAAQSNIDPELLRQLQRAQESGPVVQPSPLDSARQAPEATLTAEQQAALLMQEEPEDVVFSRLERDYAKRLGIELPDRLSPEEYEDLANEEESIRTISQFGYDLFQEPAAPTQLSTGRISENYILGVGDELVVAFQGGTERTVVTRVDREGRVILPDIRPINAIGRRFGDFRRELEDQVAQALLGTQVYVSLGSVRQISVYVLGEVEKPGVRQVTSLATPLEVLTHAGGIKKSGSLRNIAIVNNGDRQNFDVYELLSSGAGADIQLSDGARIIVPLIGETSAVFGHVKRPGIYELSENRDPRSAASMVALAGGTIRPRGYEFLVNRVAEDGRQTVTSLNSLDETMAFGDILIARVRRDVRIGQVDLVGHTTVPGPRSLDAAPTVASLISDSDVLALGPYLLMAVLQTTDDASQSRIFQPINLKDVLDGKTDIPLKNNDRLIVLGEQDVAFLSVEEIRNVIITGRAEFGTNIRRCPALVALGEVVAQSTSSRFAPVIRNIFVSSTAEEVAEAEGAGGTETGNQPGVVEEAEVEDVALAERFCPSIYRNYPEILPFVLEHAVALAGAVRRPGVYPVAGSSALNPLISGAGGFANDADLANVEIQSHNPNVASTLRQERRYYDLTSVDAAGVNVVPGSSVRINSLLTDEEPGAVLLSGEFRRPGVYSIRKGETLSQIIDRAGGLTELAYPYGAVFTRERVKADQRQAFRRAARELNNALTVSAIRNNLEAESITAAQGLAMTLTTIEALGRVVVESDPEVLQLRPDLDTTLEAGDAIVMPKRPNFVILSGDVLNPGALQFVPGKRVEEYLAQTGGLTSTADKKRAFLVYPNGVAEPIRFSLWSRRNVKVPPGSTIVIPKDTSPFTTLEIVRDVSTILGQLALSVASIAVISNN
ncbi:MAG: SLBB domain-containing protein, partial [Sphingomonadales bacterium]|nr:SLBB domain-containing protein [Sphingomonadales bacterium]